jgi:uncharacterized membrane protein YsdA (DUF1294 family)
MATNATYVLVGLLFAINLLAFFVMVNDKHRSTRDNTTDRIPEGILFFIAAAFGAVGVYIGMFLLRHKIRKWYFLLGIPLLIFQNLATLYLFWGPVS